MSPATQDKGTGEDRLAKGPTAQEFTDVMQQVMADTHVEVETKHQDKLTWSGQVHKAKYSFDSARIHQSALNTRGDDGSPSMLSDVGFLPHMRIILPPYSPDLHKIIEHAHARAMYHFRKWLYQDPTKYTDVEVYKTKFEELFIQANSANAVKADVASLKETYKYVKDNWGSWPPACLR